MLVLDYELHRFSQKIFLHRNFSDLSVSLGMFLCRNLKNQLHYPGELHVTFLETPVCRSSGDKHEEL